MFLEAKFQPNQEQQVFLNYLLSNYFPWFWNDSIMTLADGNKSKYTSLTHCFRKRLDDDRPDWGTPNSEHLHIVESIFWHACMQNNIVPRIIHRSSANLTLHSRDAHTDIHTDHSFPHKNFIMYLNDFSSAPTYVYADDEQSLVYESKPEKNKFVVFPGLPHASGFCKENERRVVLVVTFS
jgi:hypothetical protein